jgi:hypothetical protein
MEIIKTNWITVLGIFTMVFLYAIYLNVTDINVSRNIFQSILPALILVVLYGALFWLLFLALLVLLDIFFVAKVKIDLRVRLLIEWVIVSIPFIYWAIRYRQWIFIVAVFAFLVTQLLREKSLRQIFND